ncbi:MAG TPA: hypothetical protein VFQ80_15780, partial [Thermomicrobiales bacterium]|nr:hypothetical protein [Thermomicrobiales bacterium]
VCRAPAGHPAPPRYKEESVLAPFSASQNRHIVAVSPGAKDVWQKPITPLKRAFQYLRTKAIRFIEAIWTVIQ